MAKAPVVVITDEDVKAAETFEPLPNATMPVTTIIDGVTHITMT